MLRQLVINGLAVIDALDIDLKPGMTVLTGQTGAGKSILMDALGLILGDRADLSIIRDGEKKTDIIAIFSINDATHALLSRWDIDNDGELFIQRTVSRDGRSRAYLNHTPVPVQTLREVGRYLIDIHGQHAHQSLSRPDKQRSLLDEYGQHQPLLEQLAKTYQAHQQCNVQLNNTHHGDNQDGQLALLRYQIEELTELDLSDNEYQDLVERHQQLKNAHQLLSHCQHILYQLSEGDNSMNDQFVQHRKTIEKLVRIDSSLNNVSTLINNIEIEIQEICLELKQYIDQSETDEETLTNIEHRLDKLHECSRKHRIKPELLKEHLYALTTQLNHIEEGYKQRIYIQKKQTELTQRYLELSKTLHDKRVSSAKNLSAVITEKMHELDMSGTFQIDVQSIDEKTIKPQGMDKIIFMVSTNLGQQLRPLTKVASGGELSRLSLAIQIAGLKDNGVPTMIFDEVDAGVSGSTAEIVGTMLKTLAQKQQVFCVTHLAQVASCGHQHLKVTKTATDQATFTQVMEIEKEDRIDEIARLLAGKTITDESRANAIKMLTATSASNVDNSPRL